MEKAKLDHYFERIETVFDHQLFFVVGTAQSGTTWLQLALDAHPEAMCAGEGHFVDWFGVPLSQVLAQYNDVMNQIGEIAYEASPLYTHPRAEDFNYLVCAFAAIMLSKREIPEGVQAIGDKTPENCGNLAAVSRIFPTARFVHVIRDGRDAAVAGLAAQRRLDERSADRRGDEDAPDPTIWDFATAWVRSVQAAVEFTTSPTGRGRVHTVRYEDLIDHPGPELTKVCRFLGIDDAEETAAACAAASTIVDDDSGADDEQVSDSVLSRGAVGAWRDSLDDDEVERFERLGGHLLKTFDYS